jgi:hypothetical protein
VRHNAAALRLPREGEPMPDAEGFKRGKRPATA